MKHKIINKVMLFITFSLIICNVSLSQKRYVISCDWLLLDKSHEIALQEVGTIEKTNKNDGDVEKYVAIFGLGSGTQYCAAGQY